MVKGAVDEATSFLYIKSLHELLTNTATPFVELKLPNTQSPSNTMPSMQEAKFKSGTPNNSKPSDKGMCMTLPVFIIKIKSIQQLK